MALTVHVDIVKRTGLAIPNDLLVTPWLILQLKKKKEKKMNSTLPKILNTMCEMW